MSITVPTCVRGSYLRFCPLYIPDAFAGCLRRMWSQAQLVYHHHTEELHGHRDATGVRLRDFAHALMTAPISRDQTILALLNDIDSYFQAGPSLSLHILPTAHDDHEDFLDCPLWQDRCRFLLPRGQSIRHETRSWPDDHPITSEQDAFPQLTHDLSRPLYSGGKTRNISSMLLT